MSSIHGLFGLAALLALAWCLSAERWHIPVRIVVGGVGLQIALAILLIKFPPATAVFFLLDDGVAALEKATDAGTSLVFGYLGGARAAIRGSQAGRELHPRLQGFSAGARH